MTEPRSTPTSLIPSASIDATLDIPEGRCTLSYTSINVDEVINSVRDDGAGATAVFIGEFKILSFVYQYKSKIQEQHVTLSKVRSILQNQRCSLRLIMVGV